MRRPIGCQIGSPRATAAAVPRGSYLFKLCVPVSGCANLLTAMPGRKQIPAMVRSCFLRYWAHIPSLGAMAWHRNGKDGHMLKLISPIGINYRTDSTDLMNTKRALNALGYYDIPPERGIDDWVDGATFNGIRQFQKANGLKVDGFMRPEGPTEQKINASLSEGAGCGRRRDTSARKRRPPRSREQYARWRAAECVAKHAGLDGASSPMERHALLGQAWLPRHRRGRST